MEGTIRKIPLKVEVESTGRSFKSRMFLYISQVKDGISIGAMHDEGTFQTTLTKSGIQKLRQKKQAQKYGEGVWEDVVRDLFGDYQRTKEAKELQITGRLLTANDYDIEKKELIEDDVVEGSKVWINIETTSKLPITVATFQLRAIDPEEDVEGFDPRGFQVLNWLDALCEQNERLRRIVATLTAERELLTEERDFKTQELNDIADEQQRVIEDLQDKFYQLLNSKKARIWELEGRDPHELDGLNQKYIEENKLNFNHMEVITGDIADELDEVYVKKRQQPGGDRKGKKKRIKVEAEAEEEAEEDDEEEAEEEQGHEIGTESEPETESEPDIKKESDLEIPSAEIKLEPRSQLRLALNNYTEDVDTKETDDSKEAKEESHQESDYKSDTDYSDWE